MKTMKIANPIVGLGSENLAAAAVAIVRRWTRSNQARLAAFAARPTAERDIDRAFDRQVEAEDDVRTLIREALGDGGRAVLAGGRLFLDLDRIAEDHEGGLPRMVSIDAGDLFIV